MLIEGNGYRMEKLSEARFYNLSIPVLVNAGTDKEREDWKIVGYGMPFKECIRRIVDYRMRSLEGSYSIREYLDLNKELVEKLGKDFV